MSKLSAHPSRDELNAYSLGQLPEDRSVAIDAHISECDPCCETIVELSSNDTFAGLLKEAGQMPTDQTVDHRHPIQQPSGQQEVPGPLAEHPRYEILDLVGKGGMGDVYKTRHRKMERTVALKVINRNLVRNPEVVDRFHREVKAAAQLSHPSIVTAYDADQAGDYHFMVMEYVNGVNLSEVIKERGALPMAEACEYVRQAAIGLQHAHECGMVHRDIKPHNLMVTFDGTVKILDFGLASLAPEGLPNGDRVTVRSDLTSAGAIMGTPDFISPEQANDARVADIRSDIYSLGMTLYFLLSGHVPFKDGSVMDKLKSHAEVEPESLTTLVNDIPDDLDAIVFKMIAKDPNDRFQIPEEVASALEPYLPTSQPEPKRSPQPPLKPTRKSNRVWLLTAVATLVIATILSGIVIYFQTNNGVVRVEVLDDSLAVKFSDQTIRVSDGNKEFKIGAGKPRKLLISHEGSTFEFETESFQLRRNGEITLEVDLLEGEVIVDKDGKKFDRQLLPAAAPSAIDGFLKAKDAYVRAKRLEKSGDVVKAAEAYLDAYRGDPTLLAYEHLATIKKAKQTKEFVDVFNADRLLLVPLTGNPLERIAKDLLNDQATRLDGRALLDRMWEARPNSQWPLLAKPPKDTVFRIRDELLPSRALAGDPDWKRFRANNQWEALGRNEGLLQRLEPKLRDTPEQKIHLAQTVREVEQKIEQEPRWRAGVAVLAFLEAELGNAQRAVELIETVLAETESPIICGAAMTFGQALEGKSAALDQVVMRLYEKSIAEWGDLDLGGDPAISVNASPIQNLAGLYAKYGRRTEARRLLLRLTVPEGVGAGGSDGSYLSCWQGNALIKFSDAGYKVLTEDQVPQVNCIECHRKERNLWSYLTMSDKLTELGYPVDARLSLARIDNSFGNSLSSDKEWATKRTPKLERDYLILFFQPVNERVEKAITPQAVLEAFESGVLNDVDITNPVIAGFATKIDLMHSVRGEYGKSTLYSPVIDLLELVSESEGDEEAVAVTRIDQLLAEEFRKHPDNVEAGIAATVFAFLRNDVEAAEQRAQKLSEIVSAKERQQRDVALWLVGRLALNNEDTQVIGEAFAKRALAAAEASNEPLFKEAIQREREAIAKIVALRKRGAAKVVPADQKKDLFDTVLAGDVFNTLLASIKAAELADALKGPGPVTVLAPTDAAFAKLPKQTLEDLLKPENKDKLARILKYHIIPGRFIAEDARQAKSAVTIAGEPVNIAIKNDQRLTINNAKVIAGDLEASNGVIHVINEVLIPRGRTLVSDGSMFSNVVEYDLAGNKIWQTKLEAGEECWGLDTGERVVRRPVTNEGVKKLVVYAAGDGPARELWSLRYTLDARPLPSGEVLVWGDEVLRRYDRTGQKLWETGIVWKDQTRTPLGADPLPNGNLRVLFRSSKEGVLYRPDTAIEIDKQGQFVRELPFDSKTKLLERLSNGNSLVLVEDEGTTIGKLIEERDPSGKVTWSYTSDTWVNSAQRLPNGDTLVGAKGQVKTISPNGKVTWQLGEGVLNEVIPYNAYRYYPVLIPE
ncbi:MAG: fasciclin domain-containing protein [Planctomycetota bacterium]